jgi:hypothetical protein
MIDLRDVKRRARWAYLNKLTPRRNADSSYILEVFPEKQRDRWTDHVASVYRAENVTMLKTPRVECFSLQAATFVKKSTLGAGRYLVRIDGIHCLVEPLKGFLSLHNENSIDSSLLDDR